MKDNTITWFGHASFRIETSRGKTIWIDPWFTNNPLSPVAVDAVDRADLILVTHDHFDHSADAVAISQKTGGIVVGIPETVGKFKADQDLPEGNVVSGGMGMNIGGTVTIEDVQVTMTQAFHSSESGAPCGYILTLEDGVRVYHAGDTGIFESMKTLGDLYAIDVALLPIGSCFTMDPYQAAWSLRLLRPKKAIPMHYKTFPLLVQSADAFVRQAGVLAPDVEVVVLNPGDACTL